MWDRLTMLYQLISPSISVLYVLYILHAVIYVYVYVYLPLLPRTLCCLSHLQRHHCLRNTPITWLVSGRDTSVQHTPWTLLVSGHAFLVDLMLLLGWLTTSYRMCYTANAVVVYLDDILIFSRDLETHRLHVCPGSPTAAGKLALSRG